MRHKASLLIVLSMVMGNGVVNSLIRPRFQAWVVLVALCGCAVNFVHARQKTSHNEPKQSRSKMVLSIPCVVKDSLWSTQETPGMIKILTTMTFIHK